MEKEFRVDIPTTAETLTSREEIIREIIDSKNNGNSIGIISEKLGSNMLLTTVEDVLMDADDIVVVLKPYDARGYFLPINRIQISEIDQLYPFKSTFVNPFLEQTKPVEIIDNLKSNYILIELGTQLSS